MTSAEASVASCQASLSSAQLDVERMRPLAEKGIISEVQLAAYMNSYTMAQAALEQAEATLKNARATLSWTNVTSPVDGIVGEIPYRQGSLVSSSDALTTVANIRNVYAYFSMNEKSLLDLLQTLPGRTQEDKIKSLPPVSLILADGSQYPEKGHIETISGVVDVTTGSANFRAEFPNRGGILRSGTSGKVVIPHAMKNVIVVPQKATFAQ
ncbi:MAG: efflux RND transporter periplasmic adaptor subunit [Tannerellaceae bacterium]|nr:efflux RND transporter periplasmic adaptor subunit [Tannerellaceae bacterium]